MMFSPALQTLLQDGYGLVSQSLLLAALLHVALCTLRTPRKTAHYALPFALALGILTLIPWGETGSLARWLRGVLGDPSLLLTQLAALSLLQVRFPQLALPARSQRLLAWGVLAVGLPLNVIALGGGKALLTSIGLPALDLYAWGYHPQALLLALAGIALLLYGLRHTTLLVLFAVCGLGYALHLLTSDNLWDYWVDGTLLLWSLWVGTRSLKT
jgi:hypothetical protein